MEVKNMDEKIKEGFREVADHYNKLCEKFLKSLNEMKKEVPNGFAPGSRIIDNDEIVIYYNPSDIDTQNEYKIASNLFMAINNLNTVNIKNVEQHLYGENPPVIEEYNLKELNDLILETKENPSDESFKKIIESMKNILKRTDSVYTEGIINRFDAAKMSSGGLLKQLGARSNTVKELVDKMKDRGMKVPDGLRFGSDNIYNGNLKKEDGFLIENAFNNLFNDFNKLYKGLKGKEPENAGDLRDALNYCSGTKITDLGKLDANRFDAGIQILKYIDDHCDEFEITAELGLDKFVDFVTEELGNTSEILGDMSKSLEIKFSGDSIKKEALDKLKEIKKGLDENITKYSGDYAKLKKERNIEKFKNFVGPFIQWVRGTLYSINSVVLELGMLDTGFVEHFLKLMYSQLAGALKFIEDENKSFDEIIKYLSEKVQFEHIAESNDALRELFPKSEPTKTEVKEESKAERKPQQTNPRSKKGKKIAGGVQVLPIAEPEVKPQAKAEKTRTESAQIKVAQTDDSNPKSKKGKKMVGGVQVLPVAGHGFKAKGHLNWPDWEEFKKCIGKSGVKDVEGFIQRCKSLEIGLKDMVKDNENLAGIMSSIITGTDVNDIHSLEDRLVSVAGVVVKMIYNGEDSSIEKYLNDFGQKCSGIKEKMNSILQKKDDNTASDIGDKEQAWEKIKEMIKGQLDKLERTLVRKTAQDDTNTVGDEEESFEKKGAIRRAGSRVVKFVEDGWDTLTKKPVKLTLDNTMVTNFEKLAKGIGDKLYDSNGSEVKDLKTLFKNQFSNRKNTYRSWYKYVYGIVCDIDKCIKDYNEDKKPVVQISLMYVFLRSMLHCDLKNVNTIREGIKKFVLTINGDIKSKGNIDKVDGDVNKAGTKTRQLCKDVKSNMTDILNRKKSLREEVLQKEECKKILEYLPNEHKNKLKNKIIK